MEIKYEKENKNTFSSFIQMIMLIVGTSAIIAIPVSIVWGAIYATTLFIGTLFGG